MAGDFPQSFNDQLDPFVSFDKQIFGHECEFQKWYGKWAIFILLRKNFTDEFTQTKLSQRDIFVRVATRLLQNEINPSCRQYTGNYVI